MWCVGPLVGAADAPLETPFMEGSEAIPADSRAFERAVDEARLPTRTLRSPGGAYDLAFDLEFSRESAPGKVAYLAVNLRALAPRTVWLLLGSDDQVVVWLNGKAVFRHEAGRGLAAAQNAVRLELATGDNLLVAKVGNLGGGWGWSARIEPDFGGVVAYLGEIRGSILGNATLAPGEAFRIHSPAGESAVSGEARIVADASGEECAVRISNGEGVCPELPPGTYTLHLPVEGRTLEQGFGIGTIEELRQFVAGLAEGRGLDQRAEIGLSGYQRRLELLVTAVDRNRHINDWDRGIMTRALDAKAVYAAQNYARAVRRLAAGEDPFRDRSGLSLRGFRSRIDDQVLHYRLFVPTSYDRQRSGLPLIVVLHPIFSVQRPFIDGVVVANHEEAVEWSRLAERLGVGILWTGYRVCPYGNPIEFTHLDEVLADVGRDYRLDPERLTLHAECSAAIPATLACLRDPGRFAAILYVNPVLIRYRNRFDDDGRFTTFPAYRQHLMNQNPIMLAPRLDVPVRIIHESSDPQHGAIEHSLAFVAAMTAAHRTPRFDRTKTPDGQWTSRTLYSGFEWLSRQRRSHPAHLVGRRPSEGPIATLLAERFVVVAPTGGSAEEQAAGRRVVEEFQAAWTKTNFGPCRVVTDTEFSVAGESDANVVLVGSPTSNRLWALWRAELPVELTEGEVSIGGQKVPAPAGAVQAWCQHPRERGRKVLLLGAARPEDLRFSTLELALDGWYDYAVWRRVGDQGLLMKAERYDETFRVRADPAELVQLSTPAAPDS